jgi:ubiquitin C-terminal hydrolase
VISLKRFNNSSRKDQRLVTFELENLDLSKYVKGYDKSTYKYDLYGICNHSGGVWGGHYTAYIKNADTNWYHFNDTSVKKLTDNIEHSLVSTQAYCLFYQKKNVI